MEGWQGAAQTPTVLPYLISNQVTCGQTRIMFSLLDKDNRPAAAPDRPAVDRLLRPRARTRRRRSRRSTATFIWTIEDQRGIYVVDVDLPEAGTWGAEFTTAAPGGPAETIRATFDVLDVVDRGQGRQTAPPSIKTPTARRRRRRRVEDLDRHRSPTRPSTRRRSPTRSRRTSRSSSCSRRRSSAPAQQCGPTLDRIKPVAAANPAVTFINVEPYQLHDVDGQLQPVLDANGQLQATDVTNAWGLLTEPWIFAVDARRRRPRLVRAHRDRPGDQGRDRRRSRSRARPDAPARPRGTRLRASTGRRGTRPGPGCAVAWCSARCPGGNCGAVLELGEPEGEDAAVGRPQGEAADIGQRLRVDGDRRRRRSSPRPPAVSARSTLPPAEQEGGAAGQRDDDDQGEREQVPGPPIHRIRRRSRCSRGRGAAMPAAQPRAGRRRPARTSAGRAPRARGAGRPGRSSGEVSVVVPPLRSTRTAHSTISPPIASTAGSIASSEPPVVRMSSTSSTRSPGSIRKPRRNSRWVAPSSILDLLGEEAPDPELARRLEGEDHAAGRRAGDEVDQRRAVVTADARGPELAQLARGGRVREHRELLDVGVAVAPALELEVALAEGAGAPEQRLGALRDRGPGGGFDGRLDTVVIRRPSLPGRNAVRGGIRRPWRTGSRACFGSAVPMRSR